MKVLDLYCCEGGAGMGYRQAGADMVLGVDTGRFGRRYASVGGYLRANVLELELSFLRLFDLIHASPPCQFGTALRFAPNAKGAAGHLNLIPATRALLQASGVPYVIENVAAVKGHLIDPVMLNGFMFGLGATTSAGQRFHLERERWFETSWGLQPPAWAWKAQAPVIGMYGGHVRNRSVAHGGRGTLDFPGEDRPALAAEAMGMSWASMNGMSEAIPPAMTQFIGDAFMAHQAGEDPAIWRDVRQYLRSEAA